MGSHPINKKKLLNFPWKDFSEKKAEFLYFFYSMVSLTKDKDFIVVSCCWQIKSRRRKTAGINPVIRIHGVDLSGRLLVPPIIIITSSCDEQSLQTRVTTKVIMNLIALYTHTHPTRCIVMILTHSKKQGWKSSSCK